MGAVESSGSIAGFSVGDMEVAFAFISGFSGSGDSLSARLPMLFRDTFSRGSEVSASSIASPSVLAALDAIS